MSKQSEAYADQKISELIATPNAEDRQRVEERHKLLAEHDGHKAMLADPTYQRLVKRWKKAVKKHGAQAVGVAQGVLQGIAELRRHYGVPDAGAILTPADLVRWIDSQLMVLDTLDAQHGGPCLDQWEKLASEARRHAERLRGKDDRLPELPAVEARPRPALEHLCEWAGAGPADAAPSDENEPNELVVGEYKSGAWFNENTQIPSSRLRKASASSRVSKRVRKETIDGVECYSVKDARHWWSHHFTKA